ncbi:MAG: ABC transporter ATP-binding protein, partial [Bacteroidota bacterium]
MQITLNQLTAHYQNRSVLRDVSVSFVSGLSYLIGANGSGKTTLLHCLAGLHPFGGDILLDGKALPSGRNLAQMIALVPQRIELPFRFSVEEYVLMGRFPYLNWLGTYQPEDRERARQAMSDLGISGFAERSLQQLSGGELQKVLLARAICQDTPVLLLDEPAQSLDPWQQNWLYQQLEAL